MKLGYVVLYVDNVDSTQSFWVEKVGAKVAGVNQVGDFSIVKLSLPGAGAEIELVPRELMKDNPDQLDLATPSMCFYTADVVQERARLETVGVTVAPIRDHFGTLTFAFSDNENRWFAVMQVA